MRKSIDDSRNGILIDEKVQYTHAEKYNDKEFIFTSQLISAYMMRRTHMIDVVVEERIMLKRIIQK
jgi:hypothetical protein